MNELTDTHQKQPKLALQTSKSLTHKKYNTLEDFPDNQNSINNPNGITSTPPFYTKRPKRLQMTRLELFPKRKQCNQPNTHHRTSTLHSSSVQHPTLHKNSNVNTTPNDIIVDTLLSMMTLTALSKYIPNKLHFCSAIFLNSNHSASTYPIKRLPAKSNSLFSLEILFEIELVSPPETTSVVEIRIHRPHNPTLKTRMITQTPTKVD